MQVDPEASGLEEFLRTLVWFGKRQKAVRISAFRGA